MGRYFIYAILLYGLVVVVYLWRERRRKKKLNAGRKKGFTPFRPAPKEDIIGKSLFTLSHSRPQATTLEMSEKAVGNPPIFAPGNGQTGTEEPGAQVRQSEAGTGTDAGATEENSGETDVDIVIDNDEPEGEFDNDDQGDLDAWESEAAEEEESPGSRAAGIGFDELAGMAKTVENADTATAEEREEAGRVLAEVRMTEIIDQIAPDQGRKKVVSSLMDEYFTAYHRRTDANPEPAVKAPADFSVRGFA